MGSPLQTIADPFLAKKLHIFRLISVAVILVGVGVLAGLLIAPETPRTVKQELKTTKQLLTQAQEKIAILEHKLTHQTEAPIGQGKLSPANRARHEREGRRYIAALRKVRAQGAADLMEWFIHRWNELLDHPQDDDRIGRRAATLSLLIGGMAENLNPGDFVPWQAEFLNSKWLGGLYFDIDGNGLPGPRHRPNTHDGFANMSICHIAMALNQAMTDGRVLVMPEMRCDRPEARMSVFLQGATFDDALNEFVKAVREQGFLAAEKIEKNVRLVLVGMRPAAKDSMHNIDP